MSKTPILSTFIFVDRRGTTRGKSLNNRQKLLDRIRDSIRNANPTDIDSQGVKGGSANSQSSKSFSNPVAIAKDALYEPSFSYERNSGERDIVLVGNDVWERGDYFPIQSEGSGSGSGSGNGAGQGEDGEDDFIINISRSEFYDVYFDDCELPDMQDTAERVIPEAVWKPAGFQKEGNAAQLSVVRSFRNSIGRRRALTADSRTELLELEAELLSLNLEKSNRLNNVQN